VLLVALRVVVFFSKVSRWWVGAAAVWLFLFQKKKLLALDLGIQGGSANSVEITSQEKAKYSYANAPQ
jgi:hypothetical protein